MQGKRCSDLFTNTQGGFDDSVRLPDLGVTCIQAVITLKCPVRPYN